MKKTITAILLATVLTFGTTLANAGIIVAGRSDGDIKTDDPCVETSATDNGGIIVAGLTGIIVAGFTGIIVAGLTDTKDEEGPVNCGIIVAG